MNQNISSWNGQHPPRTTEITTTQSPLFQLPLESKGPMIDEDPYGKDAFMINEEQKEEYQPIRALQEDSAKREKERRLPSPCSPIFKRTKISSRNLPPLVLHRASPPSKGQEDRERRRPEVSPAEEEKEEESKEEKEATKRNKLRLGDLHYFTSPDIQELQALSQKELKKVKDFVIGKTGAGKISFLGEVDLSEIDDICQVVVFGKGEVQIYGGEEHPQSVGKGLNVRARIQLENCFLKDSSGKIITDQEDKRLSRRIEKMKRAPGTFFEAFDPLRGMWTFIVDHF